jgi:putative ATP-binding cassette transporter
MGLFGAISAAFVLVSAYRVYLRQLLEIRWRRAVTADYVAHWVTERAYCQERLHGGEADNPDQRIAEDARDFAASALGLSLSLLAAMATLVSFGGLLWRLSSDWALPMDGRHATCRESCSGWRSSTPPSRRGSRTSSAGGSCR